MAKKALARLPDPATPLRVLHRSFVDVVKKLDLYGAHFFRARLDGVVAVVDAEAWVRAAAGSSTRPTTLRELSATTWAPPGLPGGGAPGRGGEC